MDLQLYFRVAWRFRLLVLIGLVAALSLSFLSYVRVEIRDGSTKVTYREHEQWTSFATLLLTQPGFPYGRSGSEEASAPARFAELASVYAGLVATDPVRRLMEREGPVGTALVQAQPVTSGYNADIVLPLVSVFVTTTTPAGALELTDRAARALAEFIAREQRASGTPKHERVAVEIVKRPQEVQLEQGRSKTLPAVAFLTVMIAVFGLAFILENLRPRVRPVSGEEKQAAPGLEPSRRSA